MNKRGFTLIELLIALAIVALIGVFAAVSINAARAKQRDAVRISNVRQVQSVLENYFNETNSYPPGQLLPLGDPTQSACLNTDGFRGECANTDDVLLSVVPGTVSDGLDGLVTCGEPARNALCFTQLNDGDGYVIHFELERTWQGAGLQDGVNCAVPSGVEAGNCTE